MSKVTADDMDVVTEKSGHTAAPVAPSVCLTPIGPSPVPIPYPVTGTSAEGINGAPSRTKINGTRIGTVGGAFKAVHGNEPGTLKEVISHATGGPAPIMLGAPNVVIETGMTGITGSPLMANRSPGPGGRTAPGPAAGVASVPAFAVKSGGSDDGEANGAAKDGSDSAGGGGRGGSSSGDGSQKHASAAQEGQCNGSDPVDVITGRAYTLPAVDLELPGPLPLIFARVYSTAAAERDAGLGFGWASSWSWEIDVQRRAVVVWSDEGIPTELPAVEIGTEHVGSWGWVLRRERERFVLEVGDGLRRIFAAADESAKRWRLIEIRDRNDNRIELTYDEAGSLCEVLDSAGRTVLVQSTPSRRIAGLFVQDPAARGRPLRIARYAYDGAGNLIGAFDAEGHATTCTYDEEHRLTRKTDREGLAFFFVYDRAGRCVEAWGEYPGRKDASLAEDAPSRLADGTRARGIHHIRVDYGAEGYREVSDSTHVRRYFGNRHGLADKKVEGPGVEETAYDARGLVLAHKDGEGAVTRYERNARGRVVRVVDPLGHATTYERDGRGLVVRVVDPAGGVYEIARDDRGNVLAEADPTGATWSYVRDRRGLVMSATSPTGGVTRFAYDGAGNLVEQTDPNGARNRWEHDALGRVVREVGPLGHETRFQWTARGDLAAVHRPDGSTIRYTYDGERHLTEIHGPGPSTVGLRWAGFGKLVQRTSANRVAVRFRYNREGELVEVHNELGEVHRLHRDDAGLVVHEETFDRRTITYRRDKAGRVVRSEAAGEITELTYDAAGAIVSRTLPDDSVETFSYDVLGELTRVSWPGGELRLQRDGAGRVTREVQTFHGQENAVASLYDQTGERVLRFTTRGHVEHIDRDASGARVRSILDERHDVRHERDALGREVARMLPREGRITHEYDPLGRVQRRAATSPGSLRPVRFEEPGWIGGAAPAQPARVTAEREFQYDAAGELSDTYDRRHGWVQYDYDPAGHLLSVLHDATGVAERFQYDAAGNPREVGAADKETRTYGPGGRLLRRGETTYLWDGAGRLTEKRAPGELWRYAWDARGMLAAVDLPDGRRAEYAYDPLGRRLEARLFEAPPPAGHARLFEATRFVWDGDTIAHAIRTRAVEAGDPVVEERTFCFEDGSFVPWAQCDNTPDGYGGRRRAWAFFVNDPIGTPEELVGGDGRVLAELDRKAWGRSEGAQVTATPLRFQGQYEDQETGLFYNRFRYYDPDAGLYLSPDPVGLGGGLRPFGYAPNPTGWVDPLGLARLPRDARVNPKPPDRLPVTRPVAGCPRQNQQCQADIAAQLDRAKDIRVNQQQVDANGNRVGINRPDLQYTVTDKDGGKHRVYIEYDGASSNRGPMHEQRILANDPNAQVILKKFP